MEFAFPHKYIKNTSINGTVLTGYLLNTSRRPWIPKRIGKKKKKKHATTYDERKKWEGTRT